MGSFMLIRWVVLRACFIVLMAELHLALGLRDHLLIADLLQGGVAGEGEDDGPPVWEGLCKASVIPHGYKCDEFHVTSKDGYISGLQRIPEGLSSGDVAKKKPPVLVQHGILTDGMSWMMGSTKESLVFALADSGFDVWISNTRGSRFSKKHVSLDESQPEYWNFSWDEVAENDLPAIVDFVYNQTGQNLHYVGHSMGTTIAMAALSEGLLVDKLSSASFLSPIAYLTLMTNAAGIIASDAFLGELCELLGLDQLDPSKILAIPKLLPNGQLATMLFNNVAKRLGIDLPALEAKLISQNCCLNSTAFQFYIDHALQPASVKTLVHFTQTLRNGVVKKYDYASPDLNMKHYGKPEAPEYDLKNISKSLPLFFSYGGNDDLSDVNDVNHLLDDLSTHHRDKIKTHFVPEFAHLDFVFAINVKEKVYDTMFDFIRAHSLKPEGEGEG
ncbi:triacylglycerol lipase 2-like [Macadamia integrifolia]|uniref:triacylglycerol lipase 2-like n=1 Tax=Macadamia integrifolia TaxID=60698 RepID=UPI001C4F49AC|nr:triacylglycerol lipase 2-like [Macadamia integrifolia]